MTPEQEQAFYMGSGIHAHTLNANLRLICGLLITVTAVFIITGLIKLMESGQIQDNMRFLFYLIALAVILMIFFTFVVS